MQGGEGFIVGGGPSLKDFDWSKLRGKFTIAINRAYEKVPDADIIYFTDNRVWNEHGEGIMAHGAEVHRGVTWGYSEPNRKRHGMPEGVRLWHLTGPSGVEKTPGKLRHGMNSPYAALNLAAVHLKKNPVYLLGIDMGGGGWWHDGYKAKNRNTTPYGAMMEHYEAAAPVYASMGVKVVNLNPRSALGCFPKQDPDTVL